MRCLSRCSSAIYNLLLFKNPSAISQHAKGLPVSSMMTPPSSTNFHLIFSAAVSPCLQELEAWSLLHTRAPTRMLDWTAIEVWQSISYHDPLLGDSVLLTFEMLTNLVMLYVRICPECNCCQYLASNGISTGLSNLTSFYWPLDFTSHSTAVLLWLSWNAR